MALLDDIAAYLVAQGVVSTGWKITKAFMPAKPNKIITVYETPGSRVDNTSTENLYKPTFQVKVRGDSAKRDGTAYPTARAKMEDILLTLHDANIAGYVYVYALQSGPLPLGNDGNDRPQLTLNFEVLKE